MHHCMHVVSMRVLLLVCCLSSNRLTFWEIDSKTQATTGYFGKGNLDCWHQCCIDASEAVHSLLCLLSVVQVQGLCDVDRFQEEHQVLFCDLSK